MSTPQAELTHYAASLAECPAENVPEVVLSGRSNVGKSTLVNYLTRRKKLAHTSRHPGKTKVFIYFRMDDAWNLVDMPGYGYAKTSEAERARWRRAATEYFESRTQLVGVVQLIDMRVGPTAIDRERLVELNKRGLPLCLAMTKADKIPRSRHESMVAKHLANLRVPPTTGVVITSATARYGARELWAWIHDQLQPR